MNDTVLLAAKSGCVNSLNDVISASIPLIKSVIADRYSRESKTWLGAEDCLQDVLLHIYRLLPTIKPNTWKDFLLWVRFVTLSEVFSYVEYLQASKRCKSRVVPQSDKFSLDYVMDNDAKTPDELAIENEEWESLQEMAAGMNPEAWQVFSLSLDGVKSREIARVLGKPISRIYQLQKQAKSRFEAAIS